METYRMTTMGRTWTGELRTILYISVVGAGSLLSQEAGTPRPQESGGVPIHVILGLRLAGGSRQEL